MRITKTLLVVVLGTLLVACEEDPEGGGTDDTVASIDARPVDETPDAAAPVEEIDAAPPPPTIDAAPGTPDASPPIDAAPPAVSFSADLLPIIVARCGGCHLKDVGGAGGLSMGVGGLLAYDALVDQATVLPNPACMGKKRVDSSKPDPMESSLYEKLLGTTCGKQMPAGSMATPLEPAQIELFGRWIAAGAPNN